MGFGRGLCAECGTPLSPPSPHVAPQRAPAPGRQDVHPRSARAALRGWLWAPCLARCPSRGRFGSPPPLLARRTRESSMLTGRPDLPSFSQALSPSTHPLFYYSRWGWGGLLREPLLVLYRFLSDIILKRGFLNGRGQSQPGAGCPQPHLL